jgi:hypothetical protein
MKLADVRNLSRGDLLDALGLQVKRDAWDWVLPGVGLFAAGIAAGAVLGLMLAPRPGHALRAELVDRISAVRERQATRVDEVSPL